MSEPEDPGLDDDHAIGRVLRAAGSREQPSEEMQREVREFVHGEWRTALFKRASNRRRIWLAAAASLAIAGIGVWLMRTRGEAPSVIVANVSRTEGTVKAGPASMSQQSWQGVDARRELHARESIMTGSNGRVALALAGEISLRLDHDTRIIIADQQRIEVLAGAVYVDAGVTRASSRSLQIDTPAGAVRHVGTQYEIRLVQPGTRIRVREGRVELNDRSGATEQLAAGEQLIVSANGFRERAMVAADAPDWGWATAVAPPFDIEGRSLNEFLTWVSRETGVQVAFADAASKTEAARVVLHGSAADLAPGEALDAVLPTTRLQGIKSDGRILIRLQ